jgi:hypothetical protein
MQLVAHFLGDYALNTIEAINCFFGLGTDLHYLL